MAHSDVVPGANARNGPSIRSAARTRNGYIYGRGTQDDKSLLAAEIAVMVEIKRRNIKLGRDVILLVEADERAIPPASNGCCSTIISKIDAEFALNEGGYILETKDGPKIFKVQTTEKIPTAIDPHCERHGRRRRPAAHR